MQGVFDMVTSGVQEDPRVIPTSTLHTHILMYCTQTMQLAVADGQSWRETKKNCVVCVWGAYGGVLCALLCMHYNVCVCMRA